MVSFHTKNLPEILLVPFFFRTRCISTTNDQSVLDRMLFFGRSLSSIFGGLQHLRLGSNPLHCGCEAVWLMELYERSSEVFKGASQPSCASPSRLRGQHFNELSLSDFRCQVIMHIISYIPSLYRYQSKPLIIQQTHRTRFKNFATSFYW